MGRFREQIPEGLVGNWVHEANLIASTAIGLIETAALETGADTGVKHRVVGNVPLDIGGVSHFVFIATQVGKAVLAQVCNRLEIGGIGIYGKIRIKSCPDL